MPRGQVSKGDIKTFVEKLKVQLNEDSNYNSNEKDLTHKYLNKVLDKLGEYHL
jgi:hypothetical protein